MIDDERLLDPGARPARQNDLRGFGEKRAGRAEETRQAAIGAGEQGLFRQLYQIIVSVRAR